MGTACLGLSCQAKEFGFHPTDTENPLSVLEKENDRTTVAGKDDSRGQYASWTVGIRMEK